MSKFTEESISSLENSQTSDIRASALIYAIRLIERLRKIDDYKFSDPVLRMQLWSINQRLYLIDRELMSYSDSRN